MKILLLLIVIASFASCKKAVKIEQTAQFSQPVFIDQFINNFYGRGMITAEPIEVTSVQNITGSYAIGATTISVTDASKFYVGGHVTIKHTNGKYLTYFVSAISGNNVNILPSLTYAINTASQIEKTWFQRAHAGGFYMAQLSQEIAYATETSAAMPSQYRTLFTDLLPDQTQPQNSLNAVGSATITYNSESNLGRDGTIATPNRYNIGNTARVSFNNMGDGAETNLFKVSRASSAIASIIFMSDNTLASYRLAVLDANNNTLAYLDIQSNVNNQLAQIYKIPFAFRDSAKLKIRATVTSAAKGAFLLSQFDVFESNGGVGSVISNKFATIIGLGDSWMAGDVAHWGSNRPPLMTQLAIELPNAVIINKGIAGNKIQDLVARFDTDVTPNINPNGANYVIIEVGTNDCYSPISSVFIPNSTDYFNQQLTILINKSLAIGARPIILGIPALSQSDNDVPSFTEWKLLEYARGYERLTWQNF